MGIMDSLSVAGKSLSPRYDKLNSLWMEMEELFRLQHIPRNVWCEMASDSWYEEREGYKEYLVLAKHGGQWRICHYRGFAEDDFDPSLLKPIVEASGELRLRCIKYIRPLWTELLTCSSGFAKRLDEGIEELQSLIVNVMEANDK